MARIYHPFTLITSIVLASVLFVSCQKEDSRGSAPAPVATNAALNYKVAIGGNALQALDICVEYLQGDGVLSREIIETGTWESQGTAEMIPGKLGMRVIAKIKSDYNAANFPSGITLEGSYKMIGGAYDKDGKSLDNLAFYEKNESFSDIAPTRLQEFIDVLNSRLYDLVIEFDTDGNFSKCSWPERQKQ